MIRRTRNHVAVTPRKRTPAGFLLAAGVVLSAAALLAGGCSTSVKTAAPGAGSGSPATAATPISPVPGRSSTATAPTATTKTKIGLRIWVPNGWRVMRDTTWILTLVPIAYADKLGKADPELGMVTLDVIARPRESGTPASVYETDKSICDTVSTAQSVGWLGQKGLRWNSTLSGLGEYGEIRSTVTCVGGAGHPGFSAAFLVAQPASSDKYRADADGILAAMKRTK